MDKEKEIAKLAEIINEVAFIQAHEIDGDEHLCEIVAKAIINAGYGDTKQAVRDFAEKLKDKLKQDRQKYISEAEESMNADECYGHECGGKAEFAQEMQDYIDELLAEATGK